MSNQSAPTYARAYGSGVWHDLNRGAATWRTMCGRDATLMARFDAADMRGGRNIARTCEKCRAARGVSPIGR